LYAAVSTFSAIHRTITRSSAFIKLPRGCGGARREVVVGHPLIVPASTDTAGAVLRVDGLNDLYRSSVVGSGRRVDVLV
jgi:hypothetical protein